MKLCVKEIKRLLPKRETTFISLYKDTELPWRELKRKNITRCFPFECEMIAHELRDPFNNWSTLLEFESIYSNN